MEAAAACHGEPAASVSALHDQQNVAPLRRGFFLANDPNALAGVLSQPKHPRFLAYLILIPAQEARRGCECLTVIERVPEVFKVHFGPRLA